MAGIIETLRSRKLVQWTLAYLAGAFVVLQVLDILSDTFEWPAFVMRTATVLLGAGAIAAVIIAWFHGEKGQQQVSGRELAMLTGILVLAGVALVFIAPARDRVFDAGATQPTAPPVDEASVAVLPFRNISAEREQDFFVDGITEEILNVLAQLPGLHVPGRASSFSLRDKGLPIPEIARQLRVAHVLEGSVRKSGNRIRITAQLVDARTDKHIWSQAFDRDLSDVFAVQEEIARAIAEALRLRIRLPSDSQLVAVTTQNAKAHELYYRGLYAWRKRGHSELHEAVEYFGQAIAEDSSYAPAYAGLALTYAVLPLSTDFDRRVAIREGKAAAQRALALDPSNAQAHAALGQIAEELEFDWAVAERELDRAIALDPASATAHQWRAEVHLIKGEVEDALRETERAVTLDPISDIVQLIRGLALYEAGRTSEAIDNNFDIVNRNPVFVAANGILLNMLIEEGRFNEALTIARNETARAVVRGARDPALRPSAVRLLGTRAARAQIGQSLLARFYVRLGQPDSAAAVLHRAANRWEANLAYYANSRALQPLWGDPRFEEYRRKVGLTGPHRP